MSAVVAGGQVALWVQIAGWAISGRADSCVGAWVCRCAGVWVRGCVGAWVCGCVDVWVRGCVGANNASGRIKEKREWC